MRKLAIWLVASVVSSALFLSPVLTQPAFSAVPAVTLKSIKPVLVGVTGSAKVDVNSTVKLSGSNLGTVRGVEVDGVSASFFVQGDNMLTIRIPVGVEPGDAALTLTGEFGSVTVNSIFEVLSATELKDSKVTIGSFLGFATVYTKNLKGHRLSLRIGKQWRAVPRISDNYSYNLTKIGKGKVVTVMVYVDRKLVSVKQVTVR